MDLISSLTAACEAAGHMNCTSADDCRRLLGEVTTAIQRTDAAAHYDNFVPYHEREMREPDASWPIAALVRCIQTFLARPPWGDDAFRRSVWLTSAMARLGERGLSADAVVRTCAAPAIRRRLAFHIATAWHLSSSLSKEEEMQVPDELEPWLEQFELLTGVSAGVERVLPLEELLVKASTGVFGKFIDEWIADTAISHLIAWRLADSLKVEVLHSDVVLGGGAAATHWVFDRFSETYMDDWHEESLAWELSYATSPTLTAERAGFPEALLKERPTSTYLILEAIVRRHTTQRTLPTDAFAGIDVGQVQDQIIFLATAGDIKQAQDLARAAVEKTPHDTRLQNAFFFASIPSNPVIARGHFEEHSGGMLLTRLNVLACYLVEGKFDEAQTLLQAVRDIESTGVRAWLWSPAFLLDQSNSRVIQYYDSQDWVTETWAVLWERDHSTG